MPFDDDVLDADEEEQDDGEEVDEGEADDVGDCWEAEVQPLADVTTAALAVEISQIFAVVWFWPLLLLMMRSSLKAAALMLFKILQPPPPFVLLAQLLETHPATLRPECRSVVLLLLFVLMS